VTAPESPSNSRTCAEPFALHALPFCVVITDAEVFLKVTLRVL
jgi:hypothetical protein